MRIQSAFITIIIIIPEALCTLFDSNSFEVMAQSLTTQTCLFYFYVVNYIGLRGGYFCLEVVSTNHHHRPVWTHP